MNDKPVSLRFREGVESSMVKMRRPHSMWYRMYVRGTQTLEGGHFPTFGGRDQLFKLVLRITY